MDKMNVIGLSPKTGVKVRSNETFGFLCGQSMVSSPCQAMGHFSRPRLVLSFLALEMTIHLFAGEANLGS